MTGGAVSGGGGGGTSASVGGGGAGAPKVTKPESIVSSSVSGAGAGAASDGGGVTGAAGGGGGAAAAGGGVTGAGAGGGGAASSGGGVIGPGGRSVGGGVYGPGVAAGALPPVSAGAPPHAKLWNSSDTAPSADVPSNGAGVSGCGVSIVCMFSSSRASRRQRGPSRPMTISSRSSHASAALCVRCFGSLTSSRSIQSEIPWSIEGSTDVTGGIGSLTWRSRIAIGASVPWNGTRPVNSSKAMQPTE